MASEQFTNERRLVNVRNQYGTWKQYDIVFENKRHWDRWVDKMWGWNYKIECIYTIEKCGKCGSEHIKGECKEYP